MAEKTLKVRVCNKIDTAANWTLNNPVLLNGELGIESDTKKFKYGDGATAWNDLAYAGTDTAALQLDADKIVFAEDLVFTEAFGKYAPGADGSVTIPAEGKTLKALLLDAFAEEQQPTVVNPSVSVASSECKAYEVGTVVTPKYNASFNPGSYSFGPATGVTATAYTVSFNGANKDTATGEFNAVTVEDSTNLKITVSATYGDAAAEPNTNLGTPVSAKKISAGTTPTVSSAAITGYRNTFYGTRTNKDAVTSTEIRALQGKSNKSLANGATLQISIPVGAVRVVLAYPKTLRAVTAITDKNGMMANITSSFIESEVQVTGAGDLSPIAYRVYTLDFASPATTPNTFNVTI